MNDSARLETQLGSPSQSRPWHVRAAQQRDVEGIAAAVSELLSELGSTPPLRSAMLDATRSLLEDPYAGAILLAEADGVLVGVLAASWQIAIHIPGRYALIQDLWVHPSKRGRAIGADLLAALSRLSRKQQIKRIEVGLPSERFPHLEATEAFYAGNGFETIGTRMRRSLS